MVRDQEVVYQTARVVLDRMAQELQSAALDVASGVTAEGALGMVGTSGDLSGRPADRVDFTTTTSLPWREESPKTDLCEAGYRLEQDEDTDEVTLFRREHPLPDGDLEAGGEKVVLSRDVTALEIWYEDDEGKRGPEWDTRSGEHKERLPRTIRVRMTIRGISGREAAFVTKIHPVLSETIPLKEN